MAAESVIFEQLLVVVRHANQIQLDYVVLAAYSRRVNVTVDKTLLVQVSHCMAQHSKIQHDLMW
jgi:hypothetical protein